MEGEEFLTVNEAARRLGVKVATLYAYVSRGRLASYRQGIKRRRLYRRADIERLLELAPSAVEMAVTSTDPGLKGDTASGGGTKPATLESGVVVDVPLFVNEGDRVRVDTRSGEYVSRA